MLGCNEDSPSLKTDPAWYGGKVHFCCKLTRNEDHSSSLRLTLEKPYLGPSTRFTRRFGSDHFIRVKISQTLFYTEGTRLMEYFHQPFIFNGIVYRAFFAKDTTVFLVRTTERWTTGDSSVSSTNTGLSYLQFIMWHNPLEINCSQVNLFCYL